MQIDRKKGRKVQGKRLEICVRGRKILFKNCQKLLNSDKKTVKGKDKKSLVSCKNLMNMGTYKSESSVKSNSSEESIKTNKEANYKNELA